MLGIERVGELLCVAGPRAAGKTTFIHTLVRPEELVPASLPEQLHQMKGWNARTIGRLRTETKPVFKRLIVHYDFIGVGGHEGSLPGSSFNEEEPAAVLNAVLEKAEAANCVTLWVSPAELIRRIDLRQQAGEQAGDPRAALLGPTRGMYSEREELAKRYDRWFARAATMPFEHHWIVDTSTPELAVLSRSSWPELRARMLA